MNRTIRSGLLLILVTVFVSVAATAQAAGSAVQWLPSDPGTGWSAISQDGGTAVGAAAGQGIVWTEATGTVSIPGFEDPLYGPAGVMTFTSLSDDGRIAGGLMYGDFSSGGGVYDIETGQLVRCCDLSPPILSGDGSRAIILEDSGLGPGSPVLVSLTGGSVPQPLRPSPPLPTLDEWGRPQIEMDGLSANGRQVVGGADGNWVFWDQDEGSRLIDAPWGGWLDGAGAPRINGPGDTVAVGGLDSSTGDISLFLFDAASSGLEVVEGGLTALSISELSDDGQRIFGARNGIEGFWDPGSGFQSAPDLLASLGIDLGEFGEAIDIRDMSSDGRFLLGRSENASGTRSFWIVDTAFVPEPGTGLLLGVGLLALGRRSGRAR